MKTNQKKRLGDRVRGWFPKEPGIVHTQGTTKHRLWAARAVGYGIGLTVFAMLLAASYFFGWYSGVSANGNSMRWVYDRVLWGILFGTCWAIGMLLGERLRKKWSRT